jgi:hypothetical protein
MIRLPAPSTPIRRTLAGLPLVLAAALAGCQEAPTTPGSEVLVPDFPLEARSAGLVRVAFPAQDPGPPFYTRVTPYPELLNMVFTDGRTVAIPVYRNPACIPGDFNLFQFFDPPSAAGPGAFACPLLISGTFLIEPDAPLGTFPIQISSTGPVQFWFVDHDEFMERTADGILPMARLAGDFASLRIGTADHFEEILRPRFEPEHHVVISASGRLTDGGRFRVNVNHRGSTLRSISIHVD